MSKIVSKLVITLLGLLVLPGVAFANVTITLNPNVPSPALLGTTITWTANLQGGQQGHSYDYQFSVAPQGQSQIVRDFGPSNGFVWVPWAVEGTYVVTVVVRDVTQQPYIVFPPVSTQYVINRIVSQPGQSAVKYHHASPGRLVQRGSVHGGALDSSALPAERVLHHDDHQCGAVLFLDRKFSGCGYAAQHAVRNALGRIRHEFSEQRSGPGFHHRTFAEQLPSG